MDNKRQKKSKANSQAKEKKRPKPRNRRRKLNNMLAVLSVVFCGILFFVALGFAFHYYDKNATYALWWGVVSAVIAAIGIGCYAQAFVIKLVPPEKKPITKARPPIRGILIPANDPSPATKCPFPQANRKAVYFGNAVATINPAGKPFSLVQIANEDVLSFESTGAGIVVNATLRDDGGKVIATIKKNVFRVEHNAEFEATSPDNHSLLVLDKQDQAVLYIRYLNPEAIKVLGIFYHPQRPQPLKIEENGVTFGAGNAMQGLCLGEIGIWPGQVGLKYD